MRCGARANGLAGKDKSAVPALCYEVAGFDGCSGGGWGGFGFGWGTVLRERLTGQDDGLDGGGFGYVRAIGRGFGGAVHLVEIVRRGESAGNARCLRGTVAAVAVATISAIATVVAWSTIAGWRGHGSRGLDVEILVGAVGVIDGAGAGFDWSILCGRRGLLDRRGSGCTLWTTIAATSTASAPTAAAVGSGCAFADFASGFDGWG